MWPRNAMRLEQTRATRPYRGATVFSSRIVYVARRHVVDAPRRGIVACRHVAVGSEMATVHDCSHTHAAPRGKHDVQRLEARPRRSTHGPADSAQPSRGRGAASAGGARRRRIPLTARRPEAIDCDPWRDHHRRGGALAGRHFSQDSARAEPMPSIAVENHDDLQSSWEVHSIYAGLTLSGKLEVFNPGKPFWVGNLELVQAFLSIRLAGFCHELDDV